MKIKTSIRLVAFVIAISFIASSCGGGGTCPAYPGHNNKAETVTPTVIAE